MKISFISNFNLHTKFYTSALVLLLAATFMPARAQHEGHDMHGARPAASHAKPSKRKAKAARRTAKRRTRATTRTRPVARRKARSVRAASASRVMHERRVDATGGRHAQHVTGQPASSSTTSAPQRNSGGRESSATHEGHATQAAQTTQQETHRQHAAPAAAAVPEPHATHEARPAAAPQHQHASQSHDGVQETKAGTPASPGASDAHAGHGVQTGGTQAGNTQSSGARPVNTQTANTHAGGVDHSAHGAGAASGEAHSAGGAGDDGLMFMQGDLMSIRVGSGSTNGMPMGQMGSGTAWQPSSSPMHMRHKTLGDWLLMFHGEAKLGVNSQGGPRGITKFESQNWVMPMAFRRGGRGTLQLRGMFSLEPLTFSGAGSPQLFQNGEVYQGQSIIDAQHPHDLFMELSASYTMPVGERGTWFTYFGFPGEPALGPVAFMHRMSASENPTAPLTHHLQDSTHISFGVFTTGFTYRWLKLEGSLFNGREPDEHRYGFEFNPWNSRSVRVSVAPNDNWTMQYSYGFLKDPEQLEPGDTHRQTASIQYNKPFNRGNWATSLIWGRNREEHDGEVFKLNGYTAESTVNFLDKNYIYTRLELVDKKELLRHDELHELGFAEGFHPQFRIGAYTFGGARDIWNTDKWSVALGGDVTLYSKPEVLDALYGRNPASYKFFVRIRPAKMKMEHHGAGTRGVHDNH